jgi:hypothetical protein
MEIAFIIKANFTDIIRVFNLQIGGDSGSWDLALCRLLFPDVSKDRSAFNINQSNNRYALQNEGTTILPNVWNHPPIDMVSHSRRLESLSQHRCENLKSRIPQNFWASNSFEIYCLAIRIAV